MDIYKFFNSPDVAEHCRGIGHMFNAAESAVIVSQSKSHSLAEKHAAYREIIAEYPDMELPEGNNHKYIPSFHNALERMITYEEHHNVLLLADEPGAVYLAEIHETRGYESSSHDLDLYANYNAALSSAMKYVGSNYDERFYSVWERDKSTFMYFTIKKRYLGSDRYVVAEISGHGEIMGITNANMNIEDEGFAANLLSLYIDVPVPFKRGDLVEMDGDGSWMGNVFVLKEICRDSERGDAKSSQILRSDLMDMTADVFYEMDGMVQCDCVHFYPDLRYCKRELTGRKRILKYVSLFSQDKLCLCGLLKASEYLHLDHRSKDIKASMDFECQLAMLGDKLIEE